MNERPSAFRNGSTRAVLMTLLSFSLLTLSFGCATRRTLSHDYQKELGPISPLSEGDRGDGGNGTTILFLIDGLSREFLDGAVHADAVPETQAFFDVGPAGAGPAGEGAPDSDRAVAAPLIGKAIASFPTLTYPNISSILSAESVDRHGVIGNQISRAGHRRSDGSLAPAETLDFESTGDRDALNEMLAGHSVLGDPRIDRRSVSLSFYFRGNAAATLRDDLKTGIAYETKNYEYIDHRVIDSLYFLLRDTAPDRWPRFVFVHLIGVDSLSHELGTDSKRVRDYLRVLDRDLARVYRILGRAEREAGKVVSSILTADHGFMSINRRVDGAAPIRARYPKALVINQGRLIAAHLGGSLDPAPFDELLKIEGVETVATRTRDRLRIESGGALVRVDYDFAGGSACIRAPYRLAVAIVPKSGSEVIPFATKFACPEDYDSLVVPTLPPYFVSKLAAYFNAPERPDLLVLPARGVTFGAFTKGQHGGLTLDELEVPLLLHGFGIAHPERVFHTDDLLKFLK